MIDNLFLNFTSHQLARNQTISSTSVCGLSQLQRQDYCYILLLTGLQTSQCRKSHCTLLYFENDEQFQQLCILCMPEKDVSGNAKEFTEKKFNYALYKIVTTSLIVYKLICMAKNILAILNSRNVAKVQIEVKLYS